MKTFKIWAIRLSWLLGFACLLYQGSIFAQVWRLRSYNPDGTALMAQRKAEKALVLQWRWQPLSQISPQLQRAVLIAEDAAFYAHDGFDWAGIRFAAEKNLTQGRVVAGGSTITQQLAKNLFLSGSRTPWRKAQEAVITVMLESTLSKRRILEIYLNIVEWGNGVFGAQAAARHYYGRNARYLNRQQAATLAAMLPNPRYYDGHRQDRRLHVKSQIVLRRMSRH